MCGYIRGAMIGKGVREGGSVGGTQGVIRTGKGTSFLPNPSFSFQKTCKWLLLDEGESNCENGWEIVTEYSK